MFPLLVLGVAPGFASDAFGDRTFYYGDLHAHTGNSEDGAYYGTADCVGDYCGTLDDFAATAQANGLDFVAITDHVNGLSTGFPTQDVSAFEDGRDRVGSWNDESGGFIVLLGAEIMTGSATEIWGHRTLVMFGDDDELASLTMDELWPSGVEDYQTLTDCSEIDTWMDELTTNHGDALLFPHHPMSVSPPPFDWSCHSADYEPAVEVYSCQGNALDDAPGTFDRPKDYTASGSVKEAMKVSGYGHRLGFFASTDRHDTRPGEVCATDQANGGHRFGGGLAVVVLDDTESFSRSAIHDALVERRTYATSGPMLPAVVEYSSGGVLLGGMGEELLLPEGQDLEVTVRVPEADAAVVTEVYLAGPASLESALTDTGGGVWTATVSNDGVAAYFYVNVRIDGDAWWGEGNCTDGGNNNDEYLWLSPTWFSDGPADLDGDGVTYGDGDCNDDDPTIAPGLADFPTDGIDSDCDGTVEVIDLDSDGYEAALDCDDMDALTYPYAPEVWYDGLDQDCRGGDDYDADSDGFTATFAGGTDCDDTRALIRPGVKERWYDGRDQNCDGRSDFDRDGDGSDSDGYGGADCNDNTATIGPTVREFWYDGIDQNCDGLSDFDRDGDGFDSATYGGPDCSDRNASIAPGQPEIWYDGVDQNCDGQDDYDRDGDGWPLGTDCDDNELLIYPGAPGWDEDCTP